MLFLPYSIASVGQAVMHAMQWVQLPFHVGFPSVRVTLLGGHSLVHFPQEIHFSSDTLNFLSLTQMV
jgi:hypothetical protein